MSTLISARHFIDRGIFTCDGGSDSDCHNFPDCQCDYWELDENGKHEHPDVPQDRCWKLDWVNGYSPADTSADDLLEHEIHDGEVEVLWEGDYALWRYVEESHDSGSDS